jgi:hypothetical protein
MNNIYFIFATILYSTAYRNNLTENAFGTRPERVRNAFVNAHAFHLRSIRVAMSQFRNAQSIMVV